ncbi:MAG: cobalamin transport system substrate-binding protein [Gaiellales bacterium]|nr:cobalamin transport system substrate-binding protein [Gaiellales bacterium]
MSKLESAVVIVAIALALPGAASAAYPVKVTTPAGSITLAVKPVRIVSLSPTATEDLYAIGAGPQVRAVDNQSSYPASAPRTKLSGFTPNVEAIARVKPDLVIISNDNGGKLAKRLRALKIPVMLEPAAAKLSDVYAQISVIGVATGHAQKAKAVIARMKTRIAQIVASVPPRATPRTYYHELSPDLYSATSSTFIGQIYGLLGLKNIADAADSAGSGYPQLNAEYLISSNPDFVFLADTKCCQQDAATVAARPGWSGINAVKNGGVVNLDDDIASRWGPRIVSYLAAVAQRVAQVK